MILLVKGEHCLVHDGLSFELGESGLNLGWKLSSGYGSTYDGTKSYITIRQLHSITGIRPDCRGEKCTCTDHSVNYVHMKDYGAS
jgi:hypothetical protein